MNQLIELDKKLFLWLNQSSPEALDFLWIAFSDKFIWIPLYGLLLYLIFKQLDGRGFLIALACIGLCVLLTDQLSVHLFKNQFLRLRPCHNESLQDLLRLPTGRCGGKYGFVSSHAANAFGIATIVRGILMHTYPKGMTLLLVWAALVALSRVFLGVHFPADIAVGALLGMVIGQFVLLIFNKSKEPVNDYI